jgi:hypothetical protein
MCIFCKGDFSNAPNIIGITCDTIEVVPHIDSIHALEFTNCPNLKHIEQMPNLGVLRVTNCPKLNFVLDNFLSLRVLSIENCNISDKELPNFTKLRALHLINCPNIFKVPLYEELDVLHINNSVNVRTISASPKLTQFNCSNTEIESLPPLKNLKLLECLNCPKLTELNLVKNDSEIQYVDDVSKIERSDGILYIVM